MAAAAALALACGTGFGGTAFIGTASAADGAPPGGPRLARAVVEVVPAASGHRTAVREEITLTGVPPGGTIRGLLAVFAGATVSSPIVTAAGVRIPVTVTRAPDAWTVTSRLPAAIRTGTLRLTVTYTVTGTAETPEVPLYVPAYAADGPRVVHLSYRVPPGRAVQGDPFPVVIGRTGTQIRDLRAMPAFLGYRLGPVSTGSGPGLFTWVAVAVLAAAVLLTGVALAREGRRAGDGMAVEKGGAHRA